MNDEYSTKLPPSWVLATLGAASVINPPGSTAPAEDGDIVSFIPMASVQELTGVVDLSNRRRFSEVKKGFTRFRNGDLLFAKITPCMENGKVAVVRNLAQGIGCGSTEFHVIRPEKEVDVDYLRYYVVQSSFRRDAKRNMQGAVGQQRVPPDFLREADLPLAPEHEQKRIAERIDELFSRIEEGERALERVQKLVERCRQSVLKAAVTGELTREWREKHKGKLEPGEALLARILKARRKAWETVELKKMKVKGQTPSNNSLKSKYKEPAAPDTADLLELPHGWVWASPVQLEALVSNALTIGPFGSNLKVSDYRDKGVPLIFVRNIRTGRFSGSGTKFVTQHKAKELSSHVAKAGDVLITKMGDPPGDACRYPLDAPDAVITADCIKWTISDLIPRPSYLVSFINSHVGRMQIDRITKGVAQQKVSLDRFRQIAIALPGPEEQAKIEDQVLIEMQRIDSIRLAIENEMFRSSATRQSVLKAAFTGKLVPQDTTDEPASALLERIAAERAKTQKHTAPAKGRRKKVTA